MAIIHNLHTNPALSVSNSPATWFGPSGWARSTALHASLPRTTGWTGTAPGDPVAGRAACSPGKYYSVTVSVRFVAAVSAAYLGVDFKTSGNAFISTGFSSEYNQGAGTTIRMGVVVLAPANSDHMDLVVNGLDGEAQITAGMVREFDTNGAAVAALADDILPANYADGNSPGGSWDGTAGLSPSTITRDEPASGVAVFGALVASGFGIRTTTGSGLATFAPLLASSGLIPTAQYDRRRGRIRVAVAGVAASVVRVIVYSRPAGTNRWTVVRGGKVTVTAGVLARSIDDYEYQAGGGMQYRIDALSTLENQPDNVVQSVTVNVPDTEEQTWLKFIPAPWTNVPVELVVDDWELGQDSRSEIHEIAGTSPPIVVSDVHASTRTSVRFKTNTDADLAALRAALSQGAPAYLQVPDSIPFPTMYVSIGKHSAKRWGGGVGAGRTASRKYIVTVDLVEVAAPPPSVIPNGITWEVLADQYDTWEDVAAAFDTWEDVVG
jgi:hypothetical protein